jgi:LmbE family N-acetylglucosaminyl deacetylase
VTRRLLVSVAHPDDETFGTGSLIAAAAADGIEVTVCCATRGEVGEVHGVETNDVGALREAELREAGDVLGVSRFVLLGYRDSGMTGDPELGTLAASPFDDVVAGLRSVIDDVRPDVVVTLDPDHGDGHRDHTMIGRATEQACRSMPDVRVYAWVIPRPLLARWFGELEHVRPDSAHLDLDRRGLGRPEDQITTVLDVAHVLSIRERAVAMHRSQTSPYAGMPADLRDEFLCTDRLIRLQPAWSGGRIERSLFGP